MADDHDKETRKRLGWLSREIRSTPKSGSKKKTVKKVEPKDKKKK